MLLSFLSVLIMCRLYTAKSEEANSSINFYLTFFYPADGSYYHMRKVGIVNATARARTHQVCICVLYDCKIVCVCKLIVAAILSRFVISPCFHIEALCL